MPPPYLTITDDDLVDLHRIGQLQACLLACRKLVEERYQRRNGYEADCDVIYGDTDSVMVNFRVKNIARAMELGREAAEYVSKTFVKPIRLEFEKVRHRSHDP